VTHCREGGANRYGCVVQDAKGSTRCKELFNLRPVPPFSLQ